MKEKALQVASQQESEQQKINHLREYLQHLILREMLDLDWLSELVFHGGTALRILYDLNRFSEDLDFHLAHPTKNYPVDQKLEELKAKLELNGYEVQISSSSEGNVKNPVIKFAGGLLHEAGITPHENQKLNIKVEIDTNPPMGFTTGETLINDYFPLALNHHDKPSFIAGKCHAVLRAKGRDFFDLLFYLSRWKEVQPNFEYLNNALDQTRYDETKITPGNWRERILDRVKEVSWSDVEQDVKPFLLTPSDQELFSKELLIKELSD